jgi:hypothetical protein
MKQKEGSVFSFTTHATSQLIKFGLSLLGVFCLLGGPAWAQEDDSESPITSRSTGRGSGVSEWNIDTADPVNPVFSLRGISQATDNVFGSSTCSVATTAQYLGQVEPPAADVDGVCDPASASIASYGSYNYSYTDCLLEDLDQTFTVDLPGTVVICLPFSCFEGPLTTEAGTEFYSVKVGCTYPAFYTITTMSDLGMGTNEVVEMITIEETEHDLASGQAMLRSSSTSTGMATTTLTISEDELPANDVTIEVPGEDSTMSGIGVISGWSCLGGELAAEFRNDAGEVLATVPLGTRTPRGDTESTCGDTLNGFSATMNWNLLPAGEASIHLIQNGEELASQTFSVSAFGEEFITGMWTTTVPDFPAADQGATVEWDESQQRFVVTEIN